MYLRLLFIILFRDAGNQSAEGPGHHYRQCINRRDIHWSDIRPTRQPGDEFPYFAVSPGKTLHRSFSLHHQDIIGARAGGAEIQLGVRNCGYPGPSGRRIWPRLR